MKITFKDGFMAGLGFLAAKFVVGSVGVIFLILVLLLASCVTAPIPEPEKSFTCPDTQYIGFNGSLSDRELTLISNARLSCVRIFGPEFVCVSRFIKWAEESYSILCTTPESLEKNDE